MSLNCNRLVPARSSIACSAALIAAAVGLAACVETPSTLDQADQDLVGHRLAWQLVNDCATSIGVSPDDTIWVVGCDNRADGDIWYMRMADGTKSLEPSQQLWTKTKGQGRRVTVDNAGQAAAITSTGALKTPSFPLTDARTIVKPDDKDWIDAVNPTTCLMDMTMYHLDNFLVFQTSNGTTNVTSHHVFALRCPTSRQNGVFMHMFAREQAWTATSELAQTIALFTPGGLFSPSAAKVPWLLDSSGVMKTYNENADGTGTFTVQPSPPTTVSGLTDHYALAGDGVYEWIDADSRWSRAIDNFTPTGSITQIASAGAVARQIPSGQTQTFGPSHLWAIDTSGTIYAAIDSTVIR